MVRLFCWFLGLFFFLLLIVLPLLTTILVNFDQLPNSFHRYLAALEKAQTIAMQIFVCGWFFFVGGCFASFLNVVAWRVPRGRSILGSSHCPHCNIRLAFLDNMPMIGWLRNQGHCRNCAEPISPRYLIAELILGSVFLLLFLVEMASGGWNLPLRLVTTPARFEQVLFNPQWDLVRVFGFHLVLMSALFLFALIDADRFSIPWKVTVWPILIGIAMMLMWPEVVLLRWHGRFAPNELSPLIINKWLTPAIGVMVGTGIGWCLGSLFQRSWRLKNSHAKFNGAVSLLVVGLFLGWQAVLATSLFGSIAIWIVFRIQRFRPDTDASEADSDRQSNPSHSYMVACLMFGCLLHLLTWQWQSTFWG